MDKNMEKTFTKVPQDKLSEIMTPCLQGLSSDTPKTMKSLQDIQKLLSLRYWGNGFTEEIAADLSKRLLKLMGRGQTDEQTLAAQCLGLVALQLGTGAWPVYTQIRSRLHKLQGDQTSAMESRVQCTSTMALWSLVNGDPMDLSVTMKEMEKVINNHDQAEASPLLRLSCLNAWRLLLTLAPAEGVKDSASSHVAMLSEALFSSDKNMRVAAGEALALLFQEHKDLGLGDLDTELLCGQLKALASESGTVCREGKKALRDQRACFRQIVKSVEEERLPDQ